MKTIFEYCVLVLDLTKEEFNSPQKRLNDLGAQGWELVAVNYAGRYKVALYLKR